MEPRDSNWPEGETGRFLVTMRDGEHANARVLRDAAGLRLVDSRDLAASDGSPSDTPSSVLYAQVGIAVVDVDPQQHAALHRTASDPDSAVLAVEPERYGHALMTNPVAANTSTASHFADNAYFTWGLQATGVSSTSAGAADIRIAVLDSGLDTGHPDFVGRALLSACFVPGQSSVRDAFGHGTHVAGTCCGPRRVSQASRAYGIAHDATLLVGKVLNDLGYYQDGWLIAGIDWALVNQAQIISLSLGSAVYGVAPYTQAFEQAARRALDAGCLVIAAAGNNHGEPVWCPANSPSVLAVGAVDNALQLAAFSSIGINAGGGEVDLVGPGVSVFSSVPMSSRTGIKSGTSMATPHVSACAALWAQATGLRGRELWQQLLLSARPLPLSRQVSGAGLVQAPYA